MNAVKGSAGPNINITDKIRVNPDVNSLDFSNAGAVFKAAASVPDFGLAVKGDTITLSGTPGREINKKQSSRRLMRLGIT